MTRYFRGFATSEDGWSVESRRDAASFWTPECVVESWQPEVVERHWPTEAEAVAALAMVVTAEVHQEAAGQIAARLRNDNPHWSGVAGAGSRYSLRGGCRGREAERLALAALSTKRQKSPGKPPGHQALNQGL